MGVPAKRKYDWDALVRKYLAERTANPQLGDMEFYRNQGFTTRSRQLYAAKKMGRRMHVAYASVQDRVQSKAEDLSADVLVKLLREMLRSSETQYAIGAREITPQLDGPKDAQGKPMARMSPVNFSEAHKAMNSGIKNVVGVAKLLVGGEPLVADAVSGEESVYLEHRTTISVSEFIRRVRTNRKIPFVA